MSRIECLYSLLKHRLCLFKVTPIIRVSLHEQNKHKSYSHVQHRRKHSETQAPIWASCIISTIFTLRFYACVRVVTIYTSEIQTPVQGLTSSHLCFHGSYNLEKVLKSPWIRFRSLKSTCFLYWVLKSPWNSQPRLRKTPFPVKLKFFCQGKCGSSSV